MLQFQKKINEIKEKQKFIEKELALILDLDKECREKEKNAREYEKKSNQFKDLSKQELEKMQKIPINETIMSNKNIDKETLESTAANEINIFVIQINLIEKILKERISNMFLK